MAFPLVRELVRRALFGINAARRVAHDVVGGTSVADALSKERPNFEAHKGAQERRLAADDALDASKRLYGRTLSWHLGVAEKHCPICKRLDGHNFNADSPPPEGIPGSVHYGCVCFSGPAMPGAKLL